MTELAAATLTRLKDGPAKGKKGPATYVVDGDLAKAQFKVQFNPTTLKLSRSNNIDKGGSTTNTQKRQAFSAQPATLSFDLEFDTAEEADGSGNPKDVRDYTRIVRQFVEPRRAEPKKPPPAARFEWGSFMFQGIVTQLTEDLDYFAPNGTPLRAKVSVTITEQNPEWDAGDVGNGARDAASALRPDRSTGASPAGGSTTPSPPPGNGPGSTPSANPVSTALARAGESVQQLLTRLDADPTTWRSAMAGLDSPLGLAAGTQVQLGAAASASAGIGAGAGADASAGVAAGGGFTASAGVDAAATRAALGLDGPAALGRGATAEAAAGFVLAEVGGVARASARVDADSTRAAAASARASFSVPDSPVRVQTGASGTASASAEADARSLTYGRGIPLRARVSGDAAATPGR
ncbi:hypothetical protein [uncultured Microbacterium sp.]|uniref:CIS tube protein n=1 Tax=uncultured Microbacterium sp. TaxID=191216 RepID=UPI002613EBB0|nr:hypothetical protein [uncultured Microbacterium sp.]